MDGKKFITSGIWLTFISMIIQLAGLWFTVYFSNAICGEGMGIFQLIMSVYGLGVTIGLGGISIAVTRIVTRELELGSSATVNSVVFQAIITCLLTSLISVFLMYHFAELIASQWINDIRAFMPLRYISFSLPFLAISTCINSYFLSSRQVVLSSVLMVVENIFRITICVIFINSTHNYLENILVAVTRAIVIAECFSAILKLIVLKAKSPKSKSSLKPIYLGEILSISLPIGISGFIRSFLNMLQNILIPWGLKEYGIASITALSTYGVIRGMAIPIVVFPASVLSSFIALLIPEISRFYERGNSTAIGRAIIKSTSLTLIFSICLTGVFITYGRDIGYIAYTQKDVGGYIMLLAPLVTFMFLDDVVDCILKGLNQQLKSLQYNIIESSVRVVMLYFLVPKLGIAGYIIVIFTGNILNFALSFNRLTQIAPVYINVKSSIVKPLFAITLSCLFTKSLIDKGIIIYSYNITIILAISLTSVLFMAILWLWGAFPTGKNHSYLPTPSTKNLPTS